MIGKVYFCSISNNDKGELNSYDIEGAVKLAFGQHKLANNVSYPKVLCDIIFEDLKSFLRQMQNKICSIRRKLPQELAMSTFFGLVQSLWKRTSVKHSNALSRMLSMVKAHLFSISFMTNLYTCTYDNITAR